MTVEPRSQGVAWRREVRDIPSQGRNGIPAELEELFGDLEDPTQPFSVAQILACDEDEVYPQAAEDTLWNWGAAEYLIPPSMGGRLSDIVQTCNLFTAIARRDPTVAVSFGANLLSALPVWIAGNARQKELVATVLRTGESLAFALTERGHGSDLLANQTRVDGDSPDRHLTGEKWLISNAGRARAAVVFARSLPAGGPFGFSLYLLDKRNYPPEQLTLLDRVPTLGLRGADLSGLRFRRCPVADDQRVGDSGLAFEILHRTLSVTKILCGAIALGAADTALRIVVGFAARRQLYGDRMLNIPHVRASLVAAFLDLLACHCVIRAAARALSDQDAPHLFLAALIKYFVPVTVERVLQSLKVVLGARHFLRNGPEALFQKLVRDSSIISVFEGSTVVNLGILASQLDSRIKAGEEPTVDGDRKLIELYSSQTNVRGMIPTDLSLRQLRHDLPVEGLPGELPLKLMLSNRLAGTPRTAKHIEAMITRLRGRVDTWEAAFRALADSSDRRPQHRSARLLELAGDYCRLHVAAVCWHTWSHSPSTGDPFADRGDWLSMCLRRLLARSDATVPHSGSANRVFQELMNRWKSGREFTLLVP